MRPLLIPLLLMVTLMNGVALASKDDGMQTQCLGRFEVQIPTGARLAQFSVSREGVTLAASTARSPAALKTEWEKGTALQRGRRHAKAVNALIESKAIGSDTFILSWYDSHASVRLARIRLYYYADNHAYLLEQTGPSDIRLQREEQLVKMSQGLRSKPSGEAGLCFDNGFLLAPDDGVAESVQVSIELAGKPDLRLTLDTNTNNGELPELVTSRLANSGVEREPGFAQVRKLFDEERNMNGIVGRAAGYKVPTTATTLVHRMVFQSLGVAQADVLHPEMTFTLKSGEQRDDASYPAPSLSDEEALRLFNDMVSSLKVRAHSK